MIEKNIPIPKDTRARGAHNFHKMDVGDSVFFENQFTSHVSGKNTAYSCAIQYGIRSGKKFTGRNVEGGVRIWRIK